MIRFANGTPQAIWYSQHSNGQAFTYHAVEKKDKRPLSYSANGTHANFATAGQDIPSILEPITLLTTNRKHDHTVPGINLPEGFLLDHTDRGILWDPTLNAYAYTYNTSTRTFHAIRAEFPVAWLNFNGKWGDDQPPNEPEIFGQAKYVAGPDGPKFKSLDRKYVCPSTPCIVLPTRTANATSS